MKCSQVTIRHVGGDLPLQVKCLLLSFLISLNERTDPNVIFNHRFTHNFKSRGLRVTKLIELLGTIESTNDPESKTIRNCNESCGYFLSTGSIPITFDTQCG